MDLGNPFLVNTTGNGRESITTNKSISSSFTGKGILNDTINISA
jgi:hypothetical protein